MQHRAGYPEGSVHEEHAAPGLPGAEGVAAPWQLLDPTVNAAAMLLLLAYRMQTNEATDALGAGQVAACVPPPVETNCPLVVPGLHVSPGSSGRDHAQLTVVGGDGAGGGGGGGAGPT